VCWCTPDLPIRYCGAADCHPPGNPYDLADLGLVLPGSEDCKHTEVDMGHRLHVIPDQGRWMFEIRLRCKACKTPFLVSGLPQDEGMEVDLGRCSTDMTGQIVRLAIRPEEG
jgi:hypothetical protein